MREGDTFTVAIKFLGRRFETPFERISYEPDRLFKERAAGGPIPDREWTYTFEEVSGGTTRLTRAAEGEPGGFFKLADPVQVMGVNENQARIWRRQRGLCGENPLHSDLDNDVAVYDPGDHRSGNARYLR